MEIKQAPFGRRTALVTGATGYIGGRLIPRLLDAGWQVRCLVRDASRLQGKPWRNRVEWVEGDVLNAGSLGPAMTGMEVAYYLVHSLGSGSDFTERDMTGARHFGAAARTAGVARIIYLGGLGDATDQLSEHLASRQQTGAVLREAGVPVTEFRAGVIVGSGSLSFEMIRYLAERLPVMICPRWVYTRVQPIAIRNVLDYLVQSLSVPESVGRIVEIGGADVLTYREMMTIYAEARGLRRLLLPVPFLTPKLSSYWVHLVTPIPANIAKPLIVGLRNEIVVRQSTAAQLFPGIMPFDYRRAVALALQKLTADEVETIWTGALSTSDPDVQAVRLTNEKGMIVERRQMAVDARPAEVFRAFTGIGGTRGWLYMNWAWRLRGLIDRLWGGVGLRRGRREADHVRVGEALDFWRVEAVEPNRLMRLRAEMKLPGKAWLQFEVQSSAEESRPLLVQTAFFAPKGLGGFLYWYGLYPFHALIFGGMIRRIGERARLLAPLSQAPS